MCTTIAIGKKATSSGAVIIAHSDDDVADERLIFVPGLKWNPEVDKRPVHYDDAALGALVDPKSKKKYNASSLYRYIGDARGPGYRLTNSHRLTCEEGKEDLYDSIPLGTIPQVEQTYAYFDSNYGVMNERGLMIGECTCGAKIHPLPSPSRLFYAAELSRVALERCSEAREAVKLIGSLILTYGYYGTGETLLLGDANEAWVMEMCGYDPDGRGGLWVAQRVPDHGFFVAANQFRIREVPQEQRPESLLFSENLHDTCERLGWWNRKESPELDWAKTVSYGEYSHPYYSLRRVWRALLKAKPSANLPAWVEDGYTKAYPFSVVPDAKLDVAAVAAIYRDHYEGTEFDLTKGPAAGPWGDPTRYENNPDQGSAFQLSVNTPDGAWERPISIFRCGMLWINECGAKGVPGSTSGVTWLGLDRPAANCLIPLFCQMKDLPPCIQTMNLLKFSRDSAWWAFNFVANYMTLKYSYMSKDVADTRKKLEGRAFDSVNGFRKGEASPSVDSLSDWAFSNADEVVKEWWELAERLIVTYNDGCRTDEAAVMQKIDYPARWLDRAQYRIGPTGYSKAACLSRPPELP
jgi:dipeptidase